MKSVNTRKKKRAARKQVITIDAIHCRPASSELETLKRKLIKEQMRSSRKVS